MSSFLSAPENVEQERQNIRRDFEKSTRVVELALVSDPYFSFRVR